MILLIALILAGTITMVNLFITVIITSKEENIKEVLEENLFYMAQRSEMIQYSALSMSIHKLISKWKGEDSSVSFKIEESKTFCVHKSCGPLCKIQKVPNNIQAIEDKLRQIAADSITKPRQVTNAHVQTLSSTYLYSEQSLDYIDS